ncbi:amidase [Microbacterium sp. W4I20]|uniref:amidase n=1 Tax=Microbacterium sp. W4I20 TaxID=3042262 RepID=UPI00278B3434|nr:amidase family protein [Microbacterium sp. W4I20]MDQ0728832.1 amidase [Microbacterium sp. W4I20]
MTDTRTALWTLSAREIARRVRAREVTAREVIDAHLDRIDVLNGSLGALTVVFPERARDLADQIDRRIAAGEEVGALAGVPISIKENIDITWSASTEGWAFLADAIPDAHATMVRRLLEADAVPIGRGNMPDTGLRWDTDNELFGRTYNPWDRDRVPGGSSGGDSVAVATGMSAVGLGNDYGGSLRLPAYAAGICALRPTAGRVPASAPVGAWPLTEQFFAVNGPIARHIDDLDTVFSLIHGADGMDPTAASIPHPSGYDGPRRVAVSRDPLGWGVDPEVAQAISVAADALAADGWEVVDVEAPMIEEAALLWRRLSVTEFVSTFQPGGRSVPLGEGATRYFLDNAEETEVFESIADYSAAWGQRLLISAAWERFHAEFPIVLGPVSARRMPAIGYDLSGPEATTQLWRDHRLLVTVNFLGLPSVAVPTGVDGDGIPSGVQLIAARNGDHIALAAARAVEAHVGTFTPIERPAGVVLAGAHG